MSKTCSSHWYWLPGLLAAILAIAAIAQTFSLSADNDHEAMLHSNYPIMTAVELSEEVELLAETVGGEKVQSADEYFHVLSATFRLRAAAHRLDSLGHATSRFDELRINNLANDWVNLNQSMMYEVSTAEIETARERHLTEDYQLGSGDYDNPLVPIAWLVLKIAAFVAPLYFIVALRRRGVVWARVAFEVPEIIKWSLLWPLGLFRYPVSIDPVEQLLRIKRWLTALGSMALAASPLAVSAKISSKPGGPETEQVHWQGLEITTEDGPPSQVLPTVVVENIRFDLRGWVHVGKSSADNSGPEITMAKTRVVVAYDSFGIFSQFNVNGSLRADVIALQYRPSPDYVLQAGRLFSLATNPIPAPFLQETIEGPSLPVAFFIEGLSVQGREGNFSFGAEGSFDGEMASLFVQYHIDGESFLRVSFQQAGDSRIVVDGETSFGSNTLRAAAFYRSQGQVGAYAVYLRDIDALHQGAQLYLQAANDNGGLDMFAGVNIPANDNIGISIETNGSEFRARARMRF